MRAVVEIITREAERLGTTIFMEGRSLRKELAGTTRPRGS
jgi:hypothetical protein